MSLLLSANMEYALLTKPVLFVDWDGPCNRTLNHPVEEEILIQPLLASLAILAFLLNGLALVIFCRQRTRSIMRFNLILLSTAECLFNFMIIVYVVHSLTDISTVRLAPGNAPPWWKIEVAPRAYKVTIILIDVMVCVRNWCNLLIAASRAEVIAVSFGRRKVFTKTSIAVVLTVVALGASVLAAIRNMDSVLLICLNRTSMTYSSEQRYFLDPLLWNVSTRLWFLVQSIVPWTGVMASSVIMAVVLCTRLRTGRAMLTGAAMGQRRRSTNSALRTVLGLAITFSICELPSFMFVVVFGVDISGMDKFKTLINFSNSLIGLDSVINFCVYAAAMPQFRQEVISLLRCRGLGPSHRTDIYSPSNYLFSRYKTNHPLLTNKIEAKTTLKRFETV